MHDVNDNTTGSPRYFVEDRDLSHERIDDGPYEIRRLFQDYPEELVIEALFHAKINCPPDELTDNALIQGIVEARRFLQDRIRTLPNADRP